jgi:hypothetical protein
MFFVSASVTVEAQAELRVLQLRTHDAARNTARPAHDLLLEQCLRPSDDAAH